MKTRIIIVDGTGYVMSDDNYRKALEAASEMNSEDIVLDADEYGMTVLDFLPDQDESEDWTNLTSRSANEALSSLPKR